MNYVSFDLTKKSGEWFTKVSLNYKEGTYIDYPCLECGQKMVLKDNLRKLSSHQVGVIKCCDCDLEKKYKVFELRAIVNIKE